MVNREVQVKLLDFGIAKMLDVASTGASLALTGTGVRLMTPEYAAPEQVRGETITTATDVYCLGLVIYEVLTGRKPLQLPPDAPLEAARIVCEQEPAATGLPPDLDAVIRKCLRKEPGARYGAVAGLREDLERVLRGDAVTAYKGAWTYRAGKWARRYRWGVAAAALVFIAIAGGVIATARQARIAQRRYEDVRQLARTVIFDVYDQVEMLPAATKARETIANTARKYLEGLSADAQGDPGLAMELAQAYLKVGDVLGYPRIANLGRQKEAIESFRKAKALFESAGAREPQRPGVNRGLAQVAVRVAAIENSQRHSAAALSFADEAERLELAEVSKGTKRDWALLVHANHERCYVDRDMADGPAFRYHAASMVHHAVEWDSLSKGSESQYWRSVSRRTVAIGEALVGEPSRAHALITVETGQMRKELSQPNPHVWLKSDLRYYVAHLSLLQSGLEFPSIGNPDAALREASLYARQSYIWANNDLSDKRGQESDLALRLGMLPAKSQTDANAGLIEFHAIRGSIRELEAMGLARSFDAMDYLMLSIGGTRAMRRLGKSDLAAEEARHGLAQFLSSVKDGLSATTAHGENVLRFEQALLGSDMPTALQTARRHHQTWPLSLLLRADVAKILAISGAHGEAAQVLAGMSACEYKRRLEQELKKMFFLD